MAALNALSEPLMITPFGDIKPAQWNDCMERLIDRVQSLEVFALFLVLCMSRQYFP